MSCEKILTFSWDPPKKIQEKAQRKCWWPCWCVWCLWCGYPTAEEMAPATPTENVGGITMARSWTWLKWVITWKGAVQRMHWETEWGRGGRYGNKGQDRQEKTKSWTSNLLVNSFYDTMILGIKRQTQGEGEDGIWEEVPTLNWTLY